MDTSGIQKLIDDCHARGGGAAVVPPGDHVCGTLHLRSNVDLQIPAGTRILGSRNLADYPCGPRDGIDLLYRSRSLLVAENASNVAVTGQGLIDGRGAPDAFPAVRPGDELDRPMLMRFSDCRKIRLQDLKLQNSASWGCHFINSEEIRVEGVAMDSRVNRNNDGIDLDGCRDVVIDNCRLTTGDDAICPKSTLRATENVVIRKCTVSSDTAAFKLGTPSAVGFRNITLSDCTFRDCKLGAVKLLCVDGGTLENISISDVVMENVEGPIFVRLGSRGLRYGVREEARKAFGANDDWTHVSGSGGTGILRNVALRNIRAHVVGGNLAAWGVMITGVAGHCVRHLVLRDIDISFPGGGSAEHAARAVPEDEKRYPEQYFFGVLPAWGMFLRHAEDITLENVRLAVRAADARPAFYEEDVRGVRKQNCVCEKASKRAGSGQEPG